MAKRIALLFSNFHTGGIQRVRLKLAKGFIERGLDVDLVVINSSGELHSRIPHGVKTIDLKAGRTLLALPSLVRYLKNHPVDALLSSQPHINALAVVARRLARKSVRLVVGEHTDLGQILEYESGEHFRPYLIRLFYPHADQILAVSQGVAESITRGARIGPRKIQVIYNPIELAILEAKSIELPTHPWLLDETIPVILAVGRLNIAKDYPTLIRAFGLLQKKRELRLVILGDGGERTRLERIIAEENLDDCVALPGFVDNPYAYMSRASAFVLSSVFEGFPNALLEALACGVPVVSTNCHSGPMEILAGGQYGALVPVGDAAAMAEAIAFALDQPLPAANAKARAAEFSLDIICDQYLDMLLGESQAQNYSMSHSS